MTRDKGIWQRGFERCEGALDWAFTSKLNPLAQLGALGYFCYWIVAVSGIYLYIAFDTSITGVYQSVEYLTHEQWYLGGVMRSLHRYASDAMVLFMVLHLVREVAYGRFRGARAFSWITGVPLIWLVYAAGLSGYWLVWDELAQYIAITTTEWLDWLPVFAEPVARNFLTPDAVDDRFFSLMIFIHIFVPLFLLLVMWIHIQRISSPKVNPPKALAIGMMAMFVGLSLVFPALSHDAANLSQAPTDLRFDWFYLTFYPMLDHLPAGFMWAFASLFTVGLVGLPYMVKKQVNATAQVNLEFCNGCTWCHLDCPYAAITMVPRTDGQPFDRQAEVNPARCVGCGICSGACPTSSPYRKGDRLKPGIELDQYPLVDLRTEIEAACQPLNGPARILTITCENSDGLNISDPWSGHICVPCTGMLPPSFVDFVLARELADGLVIAGCTGGRCHHRLGLDWTEARLERTRDPHLRNRVDDDRVALLSRDGGPNDQAADLARRLRDKIAGGRQISEPNRETDSQGGAS